MITISVFSLFSLFAGLVCLGGFFLFVMVAIVLLRR